MVKVSRLLLLGGAAAAAAVIVLTARGSTLPPPPPPPPGSFTLVAVDASNNLPISGATVIYGSVLQTTDTSGSTILSNSGTQPLIVAARGYRGYGSTAYAPASGQVYAVMLTKLATPSLQSIRNSVGYVGASLASYAVMGYNNQADKGLFWNPYYDTGSGKLPNWEFSSSTYWSRFDTELATFGFPQAVWFQVSIAATTPSLTVQDVAAALSILKSKVPNATVYLSPHPMYNPPNLCATVGTIGVPLAYELVGEAVDMGLALAGPDVGPLTQTDMGGATCDGGAAVMGKQLADFFG